MWLLLFIVIVATIVSYFICKLIYRKIFKSNKKVSKFLVFLGSIGLIVFYYTPYSFYFEPSFWKFRAMCKLNGLPNDEYKYNKILSYFDTDLESLDWDELNNEAQKADDLQHVVIDYIKKITNYSSTFPKNKGKIGYNYIFLYSNINIRSKFSVHNLPIIRILVTWNSNRYYPAGNEGSGFYWSEEVLSCIDVVKENNDK